MEAKTLVRNLENIYCEPEGEEPYNIPAGTHGMVMWKSIDHLAEDEFLEAGDEEAVVVWLLLDGEDVYYEALPEELEIVGHLRPETID